MDTGDGGPLNPHASPVVTHPRDASFYGVMDMAGNVSEWVEATFEGPLNYIALTKGGNFTQSQPYSFLSAGRTGQPQGNGLDYLGFRCASSADASENSELSKATASEANPGISDPIRSRAELSPHLRKPDPSLYRSQPIRILPVANLDPDGKYQNQMEVYLPKRTTEPQNAERMLPWKLELAVPYLPDDRFGALFEQYWNLHPQILRSSFNADNTRFDVTAVKPGVMQLAFTVRGDLDFVDIDYDIKNLGNKVIPTATETCVQSLAAPNFRDHEGTRTMVMTASGFKPMTQLRGDANLRRLITQFKTENGLASGVTGPLIALVSRDRRWLVSTASMSGSPARLLNNCEYSCIHANPPSRIEPGGEVKLRERIYFLHGSLDDLAVRWKADLSKSAYP